jgi:hypothetical protein
MNDRMNDALATFYIMTDQWMKKNPNALTQDRIEPVQQDQENGLRDVSST